jgi:hypothetical protein
MLLLMMNKLSAASRNEQWWPQFAAKKKQLMMIRFFTATAWPLCMVELQSSFRLMISWVFDIVVEQLALDVFAVFHFHQPSFCKNREVPNCERIRRVEKKTITPLATGGHAYRSPHIRRARTSWLARAWKKLNFNFKCILFLN